MKTCAIILAAGRSRRMGTQKLLLPFAGKTLISHVVAQVAGAGISHIIVVVGLEGGGAAALADQPVTLAANPDADGDMLSSVRIGLRALPAECDAVLVVL